MIETEQPPVPPPKRAAHLETDVFCERCGYNLHGQPVERDPRLGLMVCRCPECGGWHAAGRGITSASLWLARLATLVLFLWVLIVLFAIFWLCMGFGAVQVTHVDEFSYRHWIADDGQPIERDASRGWVYSGTTRPATPDRIVRRAYPPKDDNFSAERHREQILIGSIILVLCDLSLGLVGGMLLVTFFWHWKRSRYTLTLLLPFAIAAFVVAAMLYADDDYTDIRGWAASRILMHAALQAVFLYIGIRIGRPLARGLLRMFIPPRPRQVFAFLWRADDKPMPAAASSS